MSSFIKVAGEPLDQTVFQYGPFVMTTREEVQKTLLDCELNCNYDRRSVLTSLLRSIFKERIRKGSFLEE